MRVGAAFTREDERMMERALVLAARGLGETSPNPAVGCVVARDGRVVGEGFHTRAGGPHAEAAALVAAGARARGATLYVTLEPCAHHGRTPPCAPLVRDSGVARVVAATRDPHPLVAGRGLAVLRRAGVAVDTGLLAGEAARLNERFLSWARRGRPFVLLKAASTLDGRIATAAGRSKWITSAPQRRQARWLRRLHDAVLVGIGTALADDPRLLPSPRTRRPFLRVVLDSRLRLSPRSRLARTASPRTPVLALCCAPSPSRRRDLERAGVEVLGSRTADALVIDLLDERRSRRSVSVSDSAVAAEYEVIVSVRYGLRDGAGNLLIEPQWLERERVYRADSDNILGSSEERTLLEREMQNELIQQAGGRAHILQADLRDLAQVPTLIKQALAFGPLYALVNNAAIFEPLSLSDTTLEDWQRNLAINLSAPFLLSQAFAAALPPGESGRIVNLLDLFEPGFAPAFALSPSAPSAAHET